MLRFVAFMGTFGYYLLQSRKDRRECPNQARPPPQMSFQNRPSTKSNLANAYNPIRHTFDTFSAHYENNNIDDDGDGAMDMAVNGFDDNGDGVVDDPDENETAPPYAAPLRGVRVVFRVYEPDSRQIKEVGIESAFTPE